MPDEGLDAWLGYLEGLHPSEIDLGLDRVGAVGRALGVLCPGVPVLTVAGTNGKGSVCALLESMLATAGYRVGVYTSPHLERFNERIRIAGTEASDAAICAALARVEAARGGISLTYFEFGTLAAFDLFVRAAVDVWVLEVGLGGRLDATNVVDADVAAVTSVGIDHVEWLGDDRDAVGREKAGIARPGRPLVIGDPDPPAGLMGAALEIGARPLCRGRDFDAAVTAGGWDWQGPRGCHRGLPLPALAGGYQVGNAAVALTMLECAGLDCPVDAVAAALRTAHVAGRFDIRAQAGLETILDVAHNPDAAAVLAVSLRERACRGRTLAVVAMYRDKDADGVFDRLADVVDLWFPASLAGPRGRDVRSLSALLEQRGLRHCGTADCPEDAWRAARSDAVAGDRIVVLGSFATVASVAAHCL